MNLDAGLSCVFIEEQPFILIFISLVHIFQLYCSGIDQRLFSSDQYYVVSF